MLSSDISLLELATMLFVLQIDVVVNMRDKEVEIGNYKVIRTLEKGNDRVLLCREYSENGTRLGYVVTKRVSRINTFWML